MQEHLMGGHPRSLISESLVRLTQGGIIPEAKENSYYAESK
jgi:hypothetical protein